MANPCMICGEEIGLERVCGACDATSNVTVCHTHDILHWKWAECPMCRLGLPATPFIRGSYTLDFGVSLRFE